MYLLTFLLMTQVVTGCKKDDKETVETTEPVTELTKVTITVDKTTKYQTIEGFGFFGA